MIRINKINDFQNVRFNMMSWLSVTDKAQQISSLINTSNTE